MVEYDIRPSDLHAAAAVLCKLWFYCLGSNPEAVPAPDALLDVLDVPDGDKQRRCDYIYSLYAAVFAVADVFTPKSEEVTEDD